MKNSVEVRTPYIDNELVKFALNTPINKKIRIFYFYLILKVY